MLGERDYAKYPFTIEAIEFVRGLKIELKDLVSPDYSRIVERAKERVREAVERSSISYDGKDVRVEIPSFPVALMFVAALKSGFLARRYALAESKRAYGLLRYEDERKILDVARTFKWSLQTVDDPTYDFRLRLFDYLRNIELLREDRWKLVNRVVGNGWVYLTRGEVARLLSEEVRRYVAGRILRSEGVRLPEELEQALEELRGMIVGYEAKAVTKELPRMALEAFPPCMQRLYGFLKGGRRLSHIERFALTSFLLNIGMGVDEVVKQFVSLADFDERMTRYQVEHIAGKRGSGTRYSPPSCDTLLTHNVCPGKNDTCKRVRHPNQYYRIAATRLARKGR